MESSLNVLFCWYLLYTLQYSYNHASSCSTTSLTVSSFCLFWYDLKIWFWSVILQEIVNGGDWWVFFRHSHNLRGTRSTLPAKPILMALWSSPVTSLLPQDILSVLVENLALCCILAKGVIMIMAGNIDRVNRWLLLNEMKLQWSILFVTHPQNRNDYGLLATKVMDIECLRTVGLSCLWLSFYTGLIEFFICFVLSTVSFLITCLIIIQ